MFAILRKVKGLMVRIGQASYSLLPLAVVRRVTETIPYGGDCIC
jgi:hypothetical protein